LLLAAASAGVFLHAGIKFPWFVFFQKDSGLRPKDAPWNMAAAMIIFSVLCLFIGIFPETFYQLLPYENNYIPYKAGKVLFYVQLLLFSGLAFFLLLPLMKRTLTISLDTDWLWRVMFRKIGETTFNTAAYLGTKLENKVQTTAGNLGALAKRHLSLSNSPESFGVFSRTWTIGTTALWVVVLLTVYALVYFT
jgi:multicomponent Na+:H+ antiporter subunit D